MPTVFELKPSTSLLKSPSGWAYIFLCLFCALAYNLFRAYFSPTPFVYDVDQYYSYLNALFIHGDLGFKFEGADQYWLMPTPSGSPVPKVTFGLALLYLPWYVLAMLISFVVGLPVNGYNEVFAWSGYYGSIVYVLVGFWFVRKSLLFYFSEKSVAFTLISLLLATNLLFYALGWNLMSHGYLFFIYSLLVWYTLQWADKRDLKNLVRIAGLLGLAVLTRPTEIIVFLFPHLWGIKNYSDCKERITTLLSYHWKLIIPIAAGILPFFLQMVYWKVYAGTWIFFSYGEEERFFWTQPELLNVLLGFRNGWIPYSLVFIFLIPGFIILYQKHRNMFFATLISFIVAVYAISSWWSWWFGGSFGMRALVQYYALLAFPLAAFYDVMLSKSRWLVLSISFCLVFFCAHTISNAMLFKGGILHWDSMTRKAYFYVQFKHKFTPQEMEYYQTLLKSPQYERAHHERTGEKWYD